MSLLGMDFITCAACGDVRGRPQHEDAAKVGVAYLRAIWA